MRQLQGVGDSSLGEWREWSGRAFHIRRRLAEAEERRVGPVVDVRGTPEALRRAQALGDGLTYAPREVLMEEIGVGFVRQDRWKGGRGQWLSYSQLRWLESLASSEHS